MQRHRVDRCWPRCMAEYRSGRCCRSARRVAEQPVVADVRPRPPRWRRRAPVATTSPTTLAILHRAPLSVRGVTWRGGPCYALRRGVFYQVSVTSSRNAAAGERRAYLPLVKAMGFAAVEVGVDGAADEQATTDLRNELGDAASGSAASAPGGALHPLSGPRRTRLERSVRYAS
jgi:hypothetical protein